MRLSGEEIRDIMREVADTPAVQATLPDGTVEEVSIVAYSESQAWDERLRKWRAAIGVQATQIRLADDHGTLAGLENFTLADLEAYSLEQLETL